MDDVKKLPAIGKIISIDFNGLFDWLKENLADLHSIWWKNYGYEKQKEFKDTDLYEAMRGVRLLKINTTDFGRPKNKDEIDKSIYENINELETSFTYGQKYFNPIQIYHTDETFTVYGRASKRDLIPTKFITFELYKTYEDILPSTMMTWMSGNPAALASKEREGQMVLPDGVFLPEKTKREATNDLEVLKKEIEDQERELKEKAELIRKQADLEIQKLKDMMAEQMAALRAKKEEFEIQLFGLEHELYLLRCYLGDSIQIAHLRKGNSAPLEQPIVLYQKLRFLDEDFAKIKTIYGHNCDDEDYVEEVFAKDDFVFEQFCPNTKCVTLFKISKDGTYYSSVGGNLFERFRYENGNRIGMLVRDGHNLYLIWTEDDKIYLKENFIYNSKTTEVKTKKDWTGREILDVDTSEVITDGDYRNGLAWTQYFSRKFLITILQGLHAVSGLIKFPKEVNFYGKSEYVIFSTADNALVDNRFGTLSDFMRKRNAESAYYDHVLPTQSIAGSFTEQSYSRSYHENHDRGRGERNRVRDCVIPNKVQRLNLIDYEKREIYLEDMTDEEIKNSKRTDEQMMEMIKKRDTYRRIYKILKQLQEEKGKRFGIKYTEVDEDGCKHVYCFRESFAGANYVFRDTLENKGCLSEDKKYHIKESCIIETKYDKNPMFYISVDKPEEWGAKRSGKVAVRSNVQIYSDEFINLTYLSSSVLTYFMESKQIGSYFGRNYAAAVEYLHKALEFVKERENEEYIKISRVLCKDVSKINNIDLIITDWKYRTNTRELTERKLKKLCIYLSELNDYEAEYKRIIQNLDWLPVKEEPKDE